MLTLTYTDRISHCQNPMGKKLLRLMAEKKTNLAIALDVTDAKELLHLADILGPEVCIIKTHVDVLHNFTPEWATQLTQLATQHDFLIFEDRKFADIGHTVKLQYTEGMYKIANWAHITNAHALPGPGIIAGLKEGGLAKGNGLLLLAQMSAKENLIDEAYIRSTREMADLNQDFVMGFIAQHRISANPGLIHLTPGIHIASNGDDLGQQYITPDEAIFRRGNDVMIVGRGIYTTTDPVATAREYRGQGWKAYERRLVDG